MQRLEIADFIRAALECSVFISPKGPGLSREELFEVGDRVGLKKGELSDALNGLSAEIGLRNSRLQPARGTIESNFLFSERPDYRNVAAFDFVWTELKEVARSVGVAQGCLERNVIVERGIAQGIPRNDIEVAITVLALGTHVVESDGTIRLSPGREDYALPSEQVAGADSDFVFDKSARALAYPLVQDVVARRTDGRPPHAEPLDAFADALEALGYKPFRLWWTQTVAEFRRADPSANRVMTAVLAAALVEGALTFVVKHARTLGLGVLGSKSFDDPPHKWKIDDLVKSAAAGQESAILDATLKGRADDLILVRQRIHAGRMLSDFPGGAPDLRPEESRVAKETAELVVRRVLDWLEKYPPTKG